MAFHIHMAILGRQRQTAGWHPAGSSTGEFGVYTQMPKWQLNRFPCWATLTPRGRETAGGEYKNSQKNAAGCGRSSRPIHSGHRPTNKHIFRWNLIFVGSGHSHGRQSRTQIRLSWLVSLENQNGRTSASSALRRVWQAPGCSRVPSEPLHQTLRSVVR